MKNKIYYYVYNVFNPKSEHIASFFDANDASAFKWSHGEESYFYFVVISDEMEK